MDKSRRNFIATAGLGIAGLSAVPAIEVLAGKKSGNYAQNSKGKAGHKWGMVIDIRKLNEKTIHDCTEACRHAHNIPNMENPKHELKWIWPEEFGNAFPGQEHELLKDSLLHQGVLVLCNHCDSPPCVRVCPTKATFKRPDGIVAMDMHRCIGCRFCMAACPYGSRSFNYFDPRKQTKLNPEFPFNPEYPTRMKGVVEKCNFCAERLAVGKQPACVEACRKNEIIFGDVEDPESVIRRTLRENFTLRRKPELGTGPQVYYIV